MEGDKKCFGLLLALFTMVGLSLSVCLDTNALKHDYEGITFIQQNIPERYTTVNGVKQIDWNYNYSRTSEFYTSLPFKIRMSGDSDFDYSTYKIKDGVPLFYIRMNADSRCNYYGFSSIVSNGSYDTLADFGVDYGSDRFSYYDTRINSFEYSGANNSNCQRLIPFGTSPQLSFNLSSVPMDYYLVVKNNMLPDWWFTSDGFYVHSKAINADNGITYNHAFSFTDMFNQPVHTLSYLQLPLYSTDDYWLNSSNFYRGREVSWRGSFEFDSPVEFTTTVGSYFNLRIEGNESQLQDIPCSANYISLEFNNTYRLEYECSGTLAYDYVWIQPVLMISSGGSSYYFKTSGDWRFGTQFLVTDNDETKGESFGSNLHGNYIMGDAKNDFSNDDQDWYESLLNLFHFDVIFPMTSLYTMFSDQPCVDIPILASMIHAEQTTYCAWFDSTTRSIVTPVMSIASTMIIFGFFVRWLKGHSNDVISFEGDTNG